MRCSGVLHVQKYNDRIRFQKFQFTFVVETPVNDEYYTGWFLQERFASRIIKLMTILENAVTQVAALYNS